MADNTTIMFTADHGDMLGEFGLWYKMSFREWSCRIPMVIYSPSQFTPRRMQQAVSLVDVLPTLVDMAAESGVDKPAVIDPLDGRSLVPLCRGNDAGDPDVAISEYLAEGTSAPMLMIRRGRYKYIGCATDPDQLFDLQSDPDEITNLAGDDDNAELLNKFRDEAAAHWNAEELGERVIADQDRRRAVHSALRVGRYQGWDFDPSPDPSGQYTRSHMDLTQFDVVSRFPRPKPFKPRQGD